MSQSLIDYQKNIKYIPLVKNQNLEEQKIDVVYTYVNANDIKWQNKIRKYNNTINRARYVEHNEIYGSLRSIEKFMNWINNIYIVTDNQKLDNNKLSQWLKNKIIYIDHKEIIPHNLLPTFNSMVIEAFIHKIPKLSNIFLYFNDDMFVGNYVKSNYFFTKENVKINNVLYSDTKENSISDLIYDKNSSRIIRDNFNVEPMIRMDHNVYVLSKDGCIMTHMLFNKELKDGFSRMRSDKTIHFLHLVICVEAYYGLTKIQYTNDRLSIYTACNKETFNNDLEKITKLKPYFYCINTIKNKCEKHYNKFIKVYNG